MASNTGGVPFQTSPEQQARDGGENWSQKVYDALGFQPGGQRSMEELAYLAMGMKGRGELGDLSLLAGDSGPSSGGVTIWDRHSSAVQASLISAAVSPPLSGAVGKTFGTEPPIEPSLGGEPPRRPTSGFAAQAFQETGWRPPEDAGEWIKGRVGGGVLGRIPDDTAPPKQDHLLRGEPAGDHSGGGGGMIGAAIGGPLGFIAGSLLGGDISPGGLLRHALGPGDSIFSPGGSGAGNAQDVWRAMQVDALGSMTPSGRVTREAPARAGNALQHFTGHQPKPEHNN